VITVPERYTQTDGRTTCDRNTALCTKVHRAVKNAGFYAFLLQKTILVARNLNQDGLIDPLGAEDVKRKTGGG